jgi:hypothetical protein
MNKKTPLTADKELFRLWYEFYRLALTSTDRDATKAVKKSKSFYKDWQVDPSEPFDPWWAKHRHLFEQRDFVRVLEDGDKRSEGSVVLEIPTSKGRTEVLAEIRSLLPSLLPAKPKKSFSGSKYLPSEIQGVKRDALRMMLDLERRIFRNDKLKGGELRERVLKFFSEERFKRKKNRVPATFLINDYADTVENVDRNIRRYRQKVRQLILNVAQGKFPGNY